MCKATCVAEKRDLLLAASMSAQRIVLLTRRADNSSCKYSTLRSFGKAHYTLRGRGPYGREAEDSAFGECTPHFPKSTFHGIIETE